VELDAHYGHDTFLIERDQVGGPLKTHLEADL
jgi:homoserine acetyltransferase